jgi:hypothetical protein
MNRKKLILCLLLLGLAGSIAYSVLRAPKQSRVATLKYRPGGAAPAARKGAAPLPAEADDAKVHLELLDREAPRFSGYRRNIFSPIFKDEVKLPPFKPLPPPPRPVLPLPPPPAPPAPAPAPPPAPTAEDIAAGELAKFTFLGFLKKNGERTVFLSSNNEIFLVKKGSNLGTKYQVTDLTEDAITIKSVAGGRELVIPLLENRALSTRRTSQRP